MKKPTPRTDRQATVKPISHPIPPKVLEAFRARKVEKGINIGRSIEDALTYALERREQWW